MGFFRVILNGNSPAPGEVWSVGFSCVGPNTDVPFLDLQQWATGIGVGLAAMTGNTLISQLSTNGTITEVRCEQRSDETDLLMQAAEYQLPVPKGGTGAASKTLQTAQVVSLITARPGRSFRGRMYWPAWAYSPDAAMRFTPAACNAALAGVDQIFDLIKAQALVVNPAYQMQLGVRSRLLHETNDVGRISCGDVPDTQRRRRDSLNEVYASAVWT